MLAVTSSALMALYRYHSDWTPLQRVYASTYLRCHVMAALEVTKSGQYRLLEVDTARGTRLALEEEVERASGVSPDLPFRLSDAAMRVGDRHVEVASRVVSTRRAGDLLSHWIYREHTLTALLRPAWWSGIVVLAIGLLVAVPADAARARDRRQGRR